MYNKKSYKEIFMQYNKIILQFLKNLNKYIFIIYEKFWGN